MLLVAGALAGCVETTQQKNARVQLQDDRLLASRGAVVVTRANPGIAVLNVRTLRGSAGTAIAVTVRNDGSRPVSDLPLNVGVMTARRRTSYLNRQPELPYFQTHLGGIGAGAQATWAFTSSRPAPRGRAFARVGASSIPVAGGIGRLPAISASITSVRSLGHGRAIASARLSNHSDIAQTGLQVYAYALAGERLAAAGAASLDSLGSGATRAVQIPLVGDPGSRPVHIEVPPTNLR